MIFSFIKCFRKERMLRLSLLNIMQKIFFKIE